MLASTASFVLATAGLVYTSSSIQAAPIVTDGATNTKVNTVGNQTDITTSTIKGKNAFNSFSKFNVNQGHTVNLHIPTSASNLVNVVRDSKTQIDGILNGYRDGKIAGNVFFLNPHGIVIGKTGVVNVGSLSLMTPTTSFVDSLISKSGKISDSAITHTLNGTVPLSNTGLITVNGKINALKTIYLNSVNVKTADTSILKTGYEVKVAFKSLVNVSDLETGNDLIANKDGSIHIVSTEKANLAGTIKSQTLAGKGGDISISAPNIDINSGAKILAESRDGSKGGTICLSAATSDKVIFSTFFKNINQTATVNIQKDAIIKGGDISIKSIATIGSNAELKKSYDSLTDEEKSKLEKYVDKTIDIFEKIISFKLSDINFANKHKATSKISIAGDISSTGKIDISSTANVKRESKIYSTFIGLINIAGEVVSTVDIAKSASIKAQTTIDIANNANNDIFAKLSTLGLVNAVPLDVGLVIAKNKSNLLTKIENGADISTSGQISINTKLVRSTDNIVSVSSDNKAMGAAVGINLNDSVVKNQIEGKIKGSVLDISAKTDIIKNFATVKTTLGASDHSSFISKIKTKAKNKVKTQLAKVISALGPKDAAKPRKTFGIAGAVAINLDNAETKNIVTNKADLDSTIGDISIKTNLSNFYKSSAVAQQFKDPPTVSSTDPSGESKKVAAAIGLSLTNLDNETSTLITGGANIDSANDINVETKTYMPFKLGGTLGTINFKTGDFYYKDTISELIKDVTSGNYGVAKGLANSWSQSASKADKVGIAGSITLLDTKNNTTSIIDGNAKLTAKNKVSIESKTELILTNLAGEFGQISLSPNNPFNSNKDLAGVGASYLGVSFDNTTKSIIGSAIVSAKDLEVNSFTTGYNIAIAAAGGSAKSIGFNGSLSNVDFNNTTISQIDDNATINVSNNLTLKAEDDLTFITSAGAITSSGSIGIGASVAINDISRDTRAVIGNLVDENGNLEKDQIRSATAGTIAVGQKLHQTATTDGLVISVSAAGAMANGKEASSKDDLGLRSLFDETEDSIGIGVSGSVSYSKLSSTTQSYVDGNVKIQEFTNEDATVNRTNNIELSADNKTHIITVSGAVSVARSVESKPTAGIAGAYSHNSLSGRTEAFMRGISPVSAINSIKIAATRTGRIFSLSAGLGGAFSKKGAAITGSASYSNFDNDTQAFLDDTDIIKAGTNRSNLSVLADDSTQIRTIAGSGSYASKAGFGSSFAISNINANTNTFVKDSNITSKDFKVQATNSSYILSVAGTAGVASEGFGFGGIASVNNISNITKSSVINTDNSAKSTIDATGTLIISSSDNTTETPNFSVEHNPSTPDKIIKDGKVGADKTETKVSSIDVISKDADLKILAISAGLSGSIKGSAAAAAVSVNNIKNNALTEVHNVNIIKPTSAKVNNSIYASTGGQIISIGLSASGSATFAGAGNVSINRIGSITKTDIKNSSINLNTGSLEVSSLDTSRIFAIASALSGSGTVAGSGVVTYNQIKSQLLTQIIDSKINISAGSLTTKAWSKGSITSLAIGGSGAGKAALAGTASFNAIGNFSSGVSDEVKTRRENLDKLHKNSGLVLPDSRTIAVRVKGSATNSITASGIVSFESVDESDIFSLAIAVAGSGAGSGSLAGSYNHIGTNLETKIQGALISANQIAASAVQASDILNINVGGAGAGGIAASASIGVNKVDSKAQTNITGNANLNANQVVSVNSLQKSDILGIAGAISGAGKAAAGASIIDQRVETDVAVNIENSSIKSLADSVLIQSKTTGDIQSYAAAGAGSGGFSAAGSSAFNKLAADTKTSITSSKIEAADRVAVLSRNKTQVKSLAGGLAISGAVGASGSICSSVIEGTTSVDITGSGTNRSKIVSWGTDSNSEKSLGLLTAKKIGDVDYLTDYQEDLNYNVDKNIGVSILAHDNISIANKSISLSGSGAVAVTGVVSSAKIDGSTLTSVAYTDINKPEDFTLPSLPQTPANVDISSNFTNDIDMLTGGGAFSGSAGIGASSTIVDTTRSTATILDNSKIYSDRTARVSSKESTDLESLTVSGAGGFVGINGGTSITNLSSNTLTSIIDSEIDANAIEILSNKAQIAKFLAIKGEGGAMTLGLTANLLKITGGNAVSIAGSSELDGSLETKISAKSSKTITPTLTSASAGAVTVTGVLNKADFTDSSSVLVKDSAKINSDESKKGSRKLTIQADNSTEVKTRLGSVQLSAMAAGAIINLTDFSSKSSVDIVNTANLNADTLMLLKARNHRKFDGKNLSASFASTFTLNGSVNIVSSGGLASDSVFSKVANAIGKAGRFVDISRFFDDDSTSDSAKENKAKLSSYLSSAKPTRTNRDLGYVSSIVETDQNIKINSNNSLEVKSITETEYVHMPNSLSVSGIAAIGGISENVSLNDTSHAKLGGTVTTTGTLDLIVNSKANITNKLYAGAGGSLAGTAAYAKNEINLHALAEIASNADVTAIGKLTVKSLNDVTTKSQADTRNVSVVGASGAWLTTEIKTTSDVLIGSKAKVTSSESDLLASNIILKSKVDENINAGSGGLANGAAAFSKTTINSISNVSVNPDAKVIIGSFKNRAGELNIKATNDIKAFDTVDLDSGGAISLALGKSVIEADNISSNIIIGNDASIKAGGDIILGTKNDINIKTHESTDTWGGAGSGSGCAKTKASSNSTVIVKTGALLESWQDLYIGAGSIKNSKADVSLDAQARVYNKTAIPIKTDPSASSVYNEDHSIDINSGASIRSVSDVTIASDKAKSKVSAFYKGTDLYRKVLSKLVGWIPGVSTDALESKGGHKKTNSQTSLTLNGEIQSGIHHWKFLYIDKNGNAQYIDPDNPDLDLTNVDVKIDHNMPTKPVDLYKSIQKTINDLRQLAKDFKEDKDASEGYKKQANFLQGIASRYVGKTAKIIEVKPVTAVSGNIFLRGDSLNATGSLEAPGDVTIKIINESDRFLKIVNEGIQPGLYIPEKAGGQILYNNVAVHNNADFNNTSKNSGSAFTSIKDATSQKPQIIVRNIFSGGANKLPTEMLIENSIFNLNGTIDLSSSGSIYIGKYVKPTDSDGEFEPVRILGQSIKISTNGDFVQGYRPGFNPAGGGVAHAASNVESEESKRENEFSATLVSKGKATSASKSSDYKYATSSINVNTYSKAKDGIIAGGCIFISAQKLNITGLIQSGIAQRNIILDKNNFVKDNTGKNTATQWKTLIDKSEKTGKAVILQKVIDPTKDVLITYKPEEGTGKNGQIIVDNVRIQGGFMELVGDILSTGNGELRVLDGYGTINLVSNMQYDTHLNGLNTGSGVEGIIRITDQSASRKIKGHSVTYQYSRVGGTVNVHKFTRDLKGNIQNPTLIKTVSGSSTTFKPTENRRYAWINKKITGIDETKTHKVVYTGIPGYNFKGERIVIGWRQTSNTTTVDATLKSYPKKVGGLYFTNSAKHSNKTYLIRYWRSIKYGKTTTYNPDPAYYHSGFQKVVKKYTYYKRTVTETFEHSLKADCPIAINFIGNENSGSLNINTPNSNLYIDGLLQNKKGNTIINAKNIYQGNDQGIIVVDNLNFGKAISAPSALAKYSTLKPVNNIGQIDNPLLIENSFESTGKVISTSADGSVFIKNASGGILLGNTNVKGNLKIDANGNLQTISSATVKGKNSELISQTGSISAKDNSAMNIEVKGNLNAQAAKDIKLEQNTGDLKIDTIKSNAGNVEITLNDGNFIDANDEAVVDPLSDAEQLSFWKKAGLVQDNSTGANKLKLQRAISSYEESKTADYQEAWNDYNQRKAAGQCSNADDYQFEYLQEQIDQFKNQGYTDQQISDKQAATNAKFTTIVKAGNYDANYKYVASASEKKSISDGSAWTIEELKFTEDTARKVVNSDAGSRQNTTGWIEQANVTGNNITLTANKGAIGVTSTGGFSDLIRLKKDVLKLYQDGFTDDSLTATQRANLEKYKRYKIALAGLEQDDIVSSTNGSLKYKLRDDIDVASSGKVKASATGDIYLGSEQDVSFDNISAGNNLRFKIDGNILPINSASYLQAKNMILEAAQGSLGSSSNMLTLKLTGDRNLVARAPEGAYLACNKTGKAILINELFGNTINLIGSGFVDQSLEETPTTRTVIAGGNIDITSASSGVGTKDNALAIAQTSPGVIKITSNDDINILAAKNSISLGDIKTGIASDLKIVNYNKNANSIPREDLKGNINLNGTIISTGNLHIETKEGFIRTSIDHYDSTKAAPSISAVGDATIIAQEGISINSINSSAGNISIESGNNHTYTGTPERGLGNVLIRTQSAAHKNFKIESSRGGIDTQTAALTAGNLLYLKSSDQMKVGKLSSAGDIVLKTSALASSDKKAFINGTIYTADDITADGSVRIDIQSGDLIMKDGTTIWSNSSSKQCLIDVKGSANIANISTNNLLMLRGKHNNIFNIGGTTTISGKVYANNFMYITASTGGINMLPGSSLFSNGKIKMYTSGGINSTQITSTIADTNFGHKNQGAIHLTAMKEIFLGNLIAQNANGPLVIRSAQGSINSNTNSLNIDAPSVDLKFYAKNGFGNSTAIRTNVASVTGQSQSTGNVNIYNQGALSAKDITTSQGYISIFSTGDLTASNIVSNGVKSNARVNDIYLRSSGNVTLTGNFSTNDNFTAYAENNLQSIGSDTQINANKITLIAKNGQIGSATDAFSIDSNGIIDAYAGMDIFYNERAGDAIFDKVYTAGKFEAAVGPNQKMSFNTAVASKLILDTDSATLDNLDSQGTLETAAPLGHAGKIYFKSPSKIETLPPISLDSISIELPRKGATLTIDSMKAKGSLNFAIDNLNANIHHIDPAGKPLLITNTGRNGQFANSININIDSPTSVLFETIKTNTGSIKGKVKNHLGVADGNILDWILIDNNLVKSRIDAIDKSPKNGLFHLWTFDGKFSQLMNNQGVTTNLHALNYQDNYLLNQNFSTENSLRRLINKETVNGITFDMQSLRNVLTQAGYTISITVPDFGARLAVLSIPGLGNMDIGYYLALGQAKLSNPLKKDRELSLLDFNQ